MRFKRGQVAIFVVVAVVIIGAIIAFAALRGGFGITGVPSELEPVFSYYQSCLEQRTQEGIDILGSQGGRIDTGAYVPGSDYAPFGSQLTYLGNDVPYWYSIEGNNLVRENVPTKTEMQQELGDYVSSYSKDCDLSQFYEQGYYIDISEPQVTTVFDDDSANMDVQSNVRVSLGDVSAVKSSYEFEVPSHIGSMYDEAIAIYNKQKSEAFLENYAVDVLRSYVPVDGVNVQCSPAIWQTQDVVQDLMNGLDANFQKIKFEGDYYSGAEAYYVVAQPVDFATKVVYSQDWPSKIEVTPADNQLMVAEPIGNQQGLGILGFCYVPYHFVYDVSFPVVIQMYSDGELFQFPVVVVIDNNVARQSLDSGAYESSTSDVCSFPQNDVRITSADVNLIPLEADISYQCFEQTCHLGRTRSQGGEAILETSLPSCVNGFLIAKSENYTDNVLLFSSNRESSADFILDRSYDVKVNVFVDGDPLRSNAVVHFAAEKGDVSAILPESSNVKLSEGSYNVSVYVYGNSSVSIPATTRTQCTEVASGGIAGFFGSTKEECFNIEVPATKIDYALRGGGNGATYLLPDELASGEINLYVSSLPVPNSMEQLQTNFQLFESMGVEIGF